MLLRGGVKNTFYTVESGQSGQCEWAEPYQERWHLYHLFHKEPISCVVKNRTRKMTAQSRCSNTSEWLMVTVKKDFKG